MLVILLVVTAVSSTAQTITITGTPQVAANVSPGFRNRVLYMFKVDVAGSTATLAGVNGITSNGNYLTADINAGSGNRGFRLWYYSNAGANSTPSFINGINNLDNMRQDGSVRYTIAPNSMEQRQLLHRNVQNAMHFCSLLTW